MRHCRQYLLMLMLVGLPVSTPAASALTLDQVRQRLTDAPIIQARFDQEQHLKLLPQPLHATGTLLVARGKGLLWHVRTPFKSRIKLINGHLYNDGQASALPGGQRFARQLMAVLSGNIDALKPHFRIQASEQGALWRLVLTPRDTALAKVIATVTLGGDRSPHYFRVDYPNGDYSLTRLTDIRYPARLSTKQEQQFAAPH